MGTGMRVLSSPRGYAELSLDEVPAGHAGVLVLKDVTVVEPAARIVLAPARGDRLVRADARVVDERAGLVAPAVSVDMEGVEVAVAADDVPGDVLSDARADRRRVARERPPVDRVEQAAQLGDVGRKGVHEVHHLHV